MKRIFGLTALLLAGILTADEPSQPYAPSKVDAKLNLTIRPDTDIVHFVRDNVDPNVYTKIYVLKHADPYELRKYLMRLVQTRKVDTSDTGIQAIKFNDGTSMLMVSAEDYRFDSYENGESIDRLIQTLDKPGIVSITGKPLYTYLPKYRSANELREMVENVGANVDGDVTENIGGSDFFRCDSSLNLMVIRSAPFSRKNIENMLKEYDRIYPEIRAKIMIYEIYAENDAKMGLDFQAWKNNDGVDLFSVGGRFMQNSALDGSNLSKGAGWSDLRYFNFNPKWNTKYVDFLVSKGKAKVLHTCEITARNNTTARIERTTQVFYAKAEPIESSEYTIANIYLPNTAFSDTPQKDKTVVTAATSSGSPILVRMNGNTATLTVLQLARDPAVANTYKMDIQNGYFQINGKNAGTSVDAGSVKIVSYKQNEAGTLTGTEQKFSSNNIAAEKGNTIRFEASNDFGFTMMLTPSITEKATILDVQISNSSLIGYDSSGNPRIQKSAGVASKFMISNSGTKLVIGGVDKRDVVRVSGGLPVLKDLPVIGWLFSTESESTKRSQLLVVAEVIPVRPQEGISASETREIRKVEKQLKKAGESNQWFYRQYWLDPNRNKSSAESPKDRQKSVEKDRKK